MLVMYMEEKLKSLIDDIRPYLIMDGGDIEFVKYEDGYLYVKLSGSCQNCIYQDNTINDTLLDFFKETVPELKGIINVDL